MDIQTFVSLGEEEAISYDFLNESMYADNSKLMKDIYQRLFLWVKENPKEYSGDTFNTYKKAFFSKKNVFFQRLKESEQDQYLEMIKQHTAFSKTSSQIFGFKTLKIQTEEELFFLNEMCNNHQLGNFGVFPLTRYNNSGATINVLRSSKCQDYMDLTLAQIQAFFDRKESNDLGKILSQAIDYCAYFNNNFDRFIELNYLQDYFVNGRLLSLSTLDFEEYVKEANQLIQKRGKRMYQKLKCLLDEDR